MFYIAILIVLASLINADIRPYCGKGTQFPNRMRRIVGGIRANKGDWGWQVIIKMNGTHVCGGSIISEEWIITAAHCFMLNTNPKLYTVDVGVNDQERPDAWSILDLRIERIIIHPNFNDITFDNDISLVKLKNRITIDKQSFKIIPVCIGDNVNLEGLTSYATGFGYLNESGTRSSINRQVILPVLNDLQCRKFFNANSQYQFCAGNRLKEYNTCRGDSGGSLVVKNTNNRWYIIGITSWGYSCGGVYTRIGYYKPWIHQITMYNS